MCRDNSSRRWDLEFDRVLSPQLFFPYPSDTSFSLNLLYLFSF